MGARVKNTRVCQVTVVTPASLGFPLSVFESKLYSLSLKEGLELNTERRLQ